MIIGDLEQMLRQYRIGARMELRLTGDGKFIQLVVETDEIDSSHILVEQPVEKNINAHRAIANCECEHHCHFGQGLSPNGNPGHKFGQRFLRTVHVTTMFGVFRVCTSCASDCFGEYEVDNETRKA